MFVTFVTYVTNVYQDHASATSYLPLPEELNQTKSQNHKCHKQKKEMCSFAIYINNYIYY